MKIFYLKIITLFCFLQITGIFAQWDWVNPRPTGNDLTDVHFVNQDLGWFVGENGEIFRTENGGQSWKKLRSFPLHDIDVIQAIDAEHIWLAAYGFGSGEITESLKIFFSSDSGNSWILQLNGTDLPPDSIKYRIKDLYFINDSIGYAVGNDGFVLKTANGGIDWTKLPPPTEYPLNEVHFINELTGYVCGGIATSGSSYPFPVSTDGLILKTTDGGSNWQMVFFDTIQVEALYFSTPMLGYAWGMSFWGTYHNTNRVLFKLKTIDGGLNWTVGQFGPVNIQLRIEDMYFTSDIEGYSVGLGGAILHTTDGGLNWTSDYPSQRFTQNLFGVFFSDASHGYTVGTDGVILQTFDGGITWQNYDSQFIAGNMWDVDFVNADTGYFIQGAGNIYRTVDKGQTWEYTGKDGIWELDFIDNLEGWAVGGQGLIFHTTDAGDNWIPQTSPVTTDLKDVKFVNNQVGWAVGDFGKIVKTIDGGMNWNIQNSTVNGTLDQIVLQDSLRVWVYGLSDAVYTQNGGLIWQNIDTFRVKFFLDPDTGWARDYDILYRTFDGGNNWEEIGQRLTGSLFFVNSNDGWAKITSRIDYTNDGGYNWVHQIAVETGHMLWDFYFVDNNHGWAVGNGGAILRYGYPEIITSVSTKEEIPNQTEKFHLFQNYPNPFNQQTVISYNLNIKSHVILKIYDILGKEIRDLENQEKVPGHYRIVWDGRNNLGKQVASGIYLYRMVADSYGETNNYVQVRKMILLR